MCLLFTASVAFRREGAIYQHLSTVRPPTNIISTPRNLIWQLISIKWQQPGKKPKLSEQLKQVCSGNRFFAETIALAFGSMSLVPQWKKYTFWSCNWLPWVAVLKLIRKQIGWGERTNQVNLTMIVLTERRQSLIVIEGIFWQYIYLSNINNNIWHYIGICHQLRFLSHNLLRR